MVEEINNLTVPYRKQSGSAMVHIFYGGKFQQLKLSIPVMTFGRPSPERAAPNIAVNAGTLSRDHGRFFNASGHWYYEDVGSMNGTILNGHRLTARRPVMLNDGDILRIAGTADAQHLYDVLVIFTTRGSQPVKWRSIDLNSGISSMTIGRSSSEALALSDGAVSRRHAAFFNSARGWAILDLNRLNGVLLNQRAISQATLLHPMDVVAIAGYFFIFTRGKLYYSVDSSTALSKKSDTGTLPISSKKALYIDIQERNVWHHMKRKTLLRDIHMEIPAGSLVLILGGSGAGKTTFMNAVMGYEPAKGNITYDKTDIYEEFEKMKYQIGYVPQQDLLRPNDTVYDTLENAARMRLPVSLSPEQRQNAVIRTLRLLGLEQERENTVSKLSGGQRKRLSIAVEYIGNPALFFLDEPDSGLDGTMAVSLFENLRTIANEGKIVLVISHSPDRVIKLFDKVIVLAKSSRDNCGRLAYYGDIPGACAFFETGDSLEKIVRRLNRVDEGGEGRADYYIDRFERSTRHGY